MPEAITRLHQTVDVDLIFSEGQTNTSTGFAQVSGSDTVLDVGGARVSGNLFIDVTAIDISSDDEKYTFELQGSNQADHSSGISVLAEISIGANEVLSGDEDLGVNRYVVPFSNVLGSTAYRHLKLRSVVAGTTPTVTFAARISKSPF